MKAITITEPGGPEVLTWTEVPDPVPGPGEVLIDVTASAVNRADLLQRQGFYDPPPGASPYPGLECSGHVAALGEGVTGWKVGQPVCALLSGGGYAEKVSVPAGQVLPVPDGVSVADAAALPEATATVWSNIFMGGGTATSSNVYMVTTLLGRAVGDLGVRRFGAVTVVRCGSVLAGSGFAVVALAPGAWVGMLGFTLLGLGLCVIVPQTFAAAGRAFPGASDSAVARLNVFNYVGFLVGSPLVGAVGEMWSYRGAMLIPMVLVLVTLRYARSFGAEGRPRGRARYRDGHERPQVVDVGRGSNEV
ncbi:MFS transporter [Streptomyces sp. NPDC006879]|uniref:MFS transporter n=1 Tax=Streptomyces sp. NPDC006879 TaxID=3364767 RepID=UPI0036C99CCD